MSMSMSTARPAHPLVPASITDRNGKQTTVYRKSEQCSANGPSLPPPSVGPPIPHEPSRGEAYAQRLAAVAADNAAWGEEHPK
jgi:hypothetical protein